MKKIWALIKKSGLTTTSLITILGLATVSSFLAVLPPHFLGATINTLVGDDLQSHQTVFSPLAVINRPLLWLLEELDISPLILLLALFFAANLLYQVIRNIFTVYAAIISNRFILFVRNTCFSKIVKGNKKGLAGFDNGDLVHRVMNDTQQLDYLVGIPLYTLFSDILDMLWISLILLMIDWKILLIMLSIMPILYLMSRRTGRVQRAFASRIQQNEAECTGVVQRVFMGIDMVKAFQGEEREIDSLHTLSQQNFATRKQSSINLGLFFPLEGSLRALGTIAVIAYAGYLAMKDPTFIGIIPVLLLYTNRFYAPLGNWARYYQIIQRGLVSFHRLSEVLSLEGETVQPSAPLPAKHLLPLEIDGHISLESGSVIPFSLHITKNSLVVIKGESGIGKTRLMKSLLGLGSVFHGRVSLGSATVNSLQNLRNHVAFASQDSHFIKGTIGENLSYPSPMYDTNKAEQILQRLRLGKAVTDTVAEYGKNLSTGEQRRLIMGRALYSDKPVLVLDEVDANIDFETREHIYHAVQEEKQRRVILMITHIYTPQQNEDTTLVLTAKAD